MALWGRDHARHRVTDGLIHHSDVGSQGGFNRSSQHLDHGGAYGAIAGMDDYDCDREAGDALAWASGAAA